MKYIILLLLSLLSLNVFGQLATADLRISEREKIKVSFFTNSLEQINSGYVLIGNNKFMFFKDNNIDHIAYMITSVDKKTGGMIFFLKRYSKNNEVNLKVQKVRLALVSKDEKFLKKNMPPIKNIKELNCSSDSSIFILYGDPKSKDSFANCLSNIKKN